MKAKIKSGHDLLFSEGYSNDWDDLETDMIINFHDRWLYIGFLQKRNTLHIYTEKGNISIVFTGEVPKLEFDHYEKDQLVLKIVK